MDIRLRYGKLSATAISKGAEMGIQISVDSDVCEGHGRCYSIAPELFEPDEIGNAVVIGDGTVPDDQQELAERAAMNCPEKAVLINGVRQ